MASVSGRPPPRTEPEISEQDALTETQILRQLEWIRNRRKEAEIAILYEKRKLRIAEEEQEAAAAADVTHDNFDIIQPKLQDAIDKAALSSTMLKKLQISDMLDKYASMSVKEKENLRSRQEEGQLEDLIEKNMVLAKKIIDTKNSVDNLIKENIGKQLLLSEMAQERHVLMQKYWKKNKKAEDSEMKKAVSNKKKNLEKKINIVKKILTVNNHVLQLVAGCSGIDWSKDPDLLSIMLECGKPIDEQLMSVS